MQQSLLDRRQNPFSFFRQSLKKYTEEGKILEKRGCLELEVEFLAEEEEINTYLQSWLKSLCTGKFRHIEITGVSLRIDSFYSYGKRYVPGPTTLLIDYTLYKSNKNLAAKRWKVERLLYERNELYPEGSPHKN